MQNIEQQVAHTYGENITYLSKNHPEVMAKIQALNSAIESGQYKAKYDLEYMDTYFDVKLLSNGNYLYASNSQETSSALAKRVDFSKSTYCFDGFSMYHHLENAEDKLKDTQKGILGIYPLMTYYLDNISTKTQLKKIDKFIFIGLGLGLHLSLIDKNIRAKHYLIIEDDLELFHLSLFCTPYYELAKNSNLQFCISENDNAFVNSFTLFLNEEWFTNKYLKYSYFPAHAEQKIKLIQHTLSSQDFMTFPYRIAQDKHLKPLEFINNNYNILNLSEHLNNTIFSKKPTLIIAAGPSLDKNTRWLLENHTKFIIVAVGSILKYLHKHKITPDLVIHLDGFDNSINLFSGFDVKSFLKDSIILFGAYAPTNVRELFTNEQCFFLEESTYYFDEFSSRHASCVGSTSIIHTLMFDAKEVYLLGLDFALDNKTGKTHSSAHMTKEEYNLNDKDTLKSEMDGKKTLFPVKGNFEQTVYSNPLFQASLQSLYLLIPHLKSKSQTIYNLNYGAFIEGTTPTPIDSLSLSKYSVLDKKEIHKEIKNMFIDNSSKKLSAEDIKSLELRLEYIKSIEKFIVEYKQNVSHANGDAYLYDLFGLVSNILHLNGKRETNNSVETYMLFFKYSVSIIYDFLNTAQIKNSKRHIKKMDKIVVEEMLFIEETYKRAYENFISSKC